MPDFEIRMLNDTEVGIVAMTERAQLGRRIAPGHTLAFKSSGEAREFVDVAEAEGYTFGGRENLGT